MNNDNYLNFFNKIVEQKLIFEKITLKKYLKDKIIERKDISKKILSCDFSICSIKLENNKYLLIEDLPLNFLISQTIVVGDRCEIFEFQIKENEKIYIAQKEIIDIIKQDYNILNLKEIKPRDIANKKYEIEYEFPQIIKDLREYIKNKNNIELDRIKLIESNEIKNFVPNAKNKHFKIATIMNIPLVQLIKNNYIKDSIINIYDTKKINEIIRPIKSYKKKITCNTYRENDLRIYNDIDKEISIKVEQEKIIEIILNCEKINFDKEKIIDEIKKYEHIEISSNHGRYPLPLWKSVERQEYVDIKNENEFLDKSGINFKLNSQIFEDLYFQTLSGEEAFYKKKFLKKKFEKTVENITNDEIIIFDDIEDLILKIIYNKGNEIKEIRINENITEKNIIQLKKKIKTIITKVILKSIEFNKYPTFNKPLTIVEKYFSSKSKSFEKNIETYNKNLLKRELFNKTIDEIERINLTIKYQKIEFNQLYFIIQIINQIIIIFEIFDKGESENILEEFHQYFKNYEFVENKVNTQNIEIEKYIDDCNFAKKIAKKHNIVIFEKIELDKELLKDITIIKDEPIYEKHIKANTQKLKQIFKYNYKDIVIEINKLDIDKINQYSVIKIKDKFITLKEDFYYIFKTYKGYHQIHENNYFKILIKD